MTDIKPNPWTTVKELVSDKKGARKFAATITIADCFQDIKGEWMTFKSEKIANKNEYELRNQRICLEIGDEEARIYDRERNSLIVASERIEFAELDENNKCKNYYGFWDSKGTLTQETTKDGVVVRREITFYKDCKLTVEYVLGDNTTLKYRAVFTDLKGEKRRVKICIVRAGIAADRFTTYETSFKGEQMIDEKLSPPFVTYGWKLEMGTKETPIVMTDDFMKEYENENAKSIVIDIRDGQVCSEFTFLFDVEPNKEAVLDPTTYTSTTVTNFNGYAYYYYYVDSYGPHYAWGFATNTGTPLYVFKFGLIGSGVPERACAQFNISAIPDNAVITSVSYLYNGYANPGGVNSYITGCLAHMPSGYTAPGIWTDVGTATVLVDSATFPVVGTGQSVSLGATGITELQGKLAVNWFALGFKNKTEGSSIDKMMRAFEYVSANPKPSLYVEYYLFSTELGSAEYGAMEIH